MDLNNPLAASSARQITGRCLLGDVEMPFVSFDVDENAFNSADTFSVTFATSGLPAGYGLAWWSTQTKITVELYATIVTADGPDDKRLILGDVDSWQFHPARFEVTAVGRDYTARFIESKVLGDSFKNLTSSQIATTLAARHGLSAVVKPTKGLFGTFSQIDTTHLQGEQTEWDLLTYLAAYENYQVYVDGTTLHFVPAITDAAKSDQYVIRWQPPGALPYPQANVSDDLLFERALTITKGVIVEVHSWQMMRKRQKQIVASYPKTSAKGTAVGGSTAKSQVYRIIRNGLTQEQATKLAEATYKKIVAHEMKVSGSTAGDNLLSSRTMVRIEGTGTVFDQLYFCDSIKRSMSFDGGYSMTFTAKNHSPAMEVSG
ncbi:phage late control D family protein [Paludibacterium yongneupense]|uniref:phage late control D family protein n=1 Tax=Paludibacterium yongneupense TaxID=400061 RepID=UPI000408C5BD|nr:type IV secretion protein Rhs [Paludibacterium yongneupense]